MSSGTKKLAGAAFVLSLVAIVVVALGMFRGAFTSTVPITVTAPRSGLVMDPDAKVKLRGVEIGRVASISQVGDGAEIELAMQPDKLSLLPANALVDIRSTTVFGAKYVNFRIPARPSTDRLTAGSTVPADAVTVEFNTLFQHLSDLLAKIRPEKLNATLGALAEALNGRGATLGTLLTTADTYLADINPSLPALQRDFTAAAEVTNLYADEADNFLRVVDNATAIGKTVVDEDQALDTLLLSVIGLGDTANSVLTANERDLGTALDLLEPTTGLLDEYHPVLTCLLVGLSTALPTAEKIFGGDQEGLALNAGFTYGDKPYTYPDSLPKVNATGGPNCHGLPFPPEGHTNYVVTDTSEGAPFAPNTRLTLNAPKVFQLLFGGVYPGVPG
ncbi:MCE family protein [Skermania piniformis]|nr:MCE family protein [Skermania piniformis]